MKSNVLLFAMLFGGAVAQAADPSLTIYNQNFAVVRDTIPLDLKAGRNEVPYHGMTSQLEADSVILRDPAGKAQFSVLEQNYRNDPISDGLLLSLNEGKTIDFLISESSKPDRVVPGKIIRSGYSPAGDSTQPIIEIEGKVRFGLPGTPLFPSLGDDTILKPMLAWSIEATGAEKFDAELCYITGGLSWEADYNISAPEKGDTLDIVGWITMDNRSGKTFDNARIKLMAGDVNKIQPEMPMAMAVARRDMMAAAPAPAVTEKAFDEYHLYTLSHPTTLRDRQTKQVEFIRATGVKARRIYVYDGFNISASPWRGHNMMNLRTNPDFGLEGNTKVAVVREFKNTKENNLGIPLPAGRVRFYRQDDTKDLEFTGENTIPHTPKNEEVRIFTGNAFDLVGERRRVDFKVDSSNNWAEETIEIKLRNRKEEAVEIRVVEHLYRWTNWEITEKSMDFRKVNAQEIEFIVPVKADEEKTVTYKVRYSW